MDKISQQLLFGKAAELPEDWAKFAVEGNQNVTIIPDNSTPGSYYLIENSAVYKLDNAGTVLSTITYPTWYLPYTGFVNSDSDVYFIDANSNIFKFDSTLTSFNVINLSNINLLGTLNLATDNVSVLNDTDVYALGFEYNSSTNLSNVIATKFNLTTGTVSYTRRFSVSNTASDSIYGIAKAASAPIDSSGYYFTCFPISYTNTSTGSTRLKTQVYKLSSTGTILASKDLLISTDGAAFHIDSYILDSSGNFYGIGWATEDFSDYRTVLVKLSNSNLSTLNVLTIYNSITGISMGSDTVDSAQNSIAIDFSNGKIYTTTFCKDSFNRYGVQLTVLNPDLTISAGFMIKIRTIAGSRFASSEYLTLRGSAYERFTKIKITGANLIIKVFSIVPTGGYYLWEFNIKLSTDNITIGEHQIGDFMVVIESIDAQVGALGLPYTFTTVSGVSNQSVSSAYIVDNTDITADVTVSGPSVPNVYTGFIS